MKGPSALTDLILVPLSLREYHFATEFYNSIDADLIAQHMRRVVWRQGDQTAEPKIYRTTTVNFGDKLAGCISIAAARETADMFSGDSQAAWLMIISLVSIPWRS